MTNRAEMKALVRILKAERALIGSELYMASYGYFHAYEYRHYLRDIPRAKYLRVYRAFLKAKLDPSGESDVHLRIIRRILKVN